MSIWSKIRNAVKRIAEIAKAFLFTMALTMAFMIPILLYVAYPPHRKKDVGVSPDRRSS